jgi:hypothetical protein
MNSEYDGVTRRKLLFNVAPAMAIAAAGVGSAMAADRSRSDPGPQNPALDAQNPDSAWPPATDSKSLVPTFKYPFSLANKRTYEGGWSREVFGSCIGTRDLATGPEGTVGSGATGRDERGGHT